MMRCMLRTNKTTQDSSSVQLQSEVGLTDAEKAFSSVRLTEQANLKTPSAPVPDLVAKHQDQRFAAASAFLKKT